VQRQGCRLGKFLGEGGLAATVIDAVVLRGCLAVATTRPHQRRTRMSDQLTLAAEPRTEFGKGASRRVRAAGMIPAVLYGHGMDPLHIVLPGRATGVALKHQNALLSIVLGKTTHMAIVKDVQRDPVHQIIEHIDLLAVQKGEKLSVHVPIHLIGESISGTIHLLEVAALHVSAEATHLPESVEVSIEDLVDGDRIHASDITLPEGVELLTPPDALVVSITIPTRMVEVVEEVEEAEVPEEGEESAEDEAPAEDE
jgi:large subunit ribosomal protein L25